MSINDKIRSLLSGELSEDERKQSEVIHILDREIKAAVASGHKKCNRKGLPCDLTALLWVFATCMVQATKAYNETTNDKVKREFIEELVEAAFDTEFEGEEAALLARWDHRQGGSN